MNNKCINGEGTTLLHRKILTNKCRQNKENTKSPSGRHHNIAAGKVDVGCLWRNMKISLQVSPPRYYQLQRENSNRAEQKLRRYHLSQVAQARYFIFTCSRQATLRREHVSSVDLLAKQPQSSHKNTDQLKLRDNLQTTDYHSPKRSWS